ncbi:hypothetical protein HYV30_03120 [Candidatus Kaiserbacteria bacterium]|nr:hypothetical protein [Candidatus Kaiserbacteria bacterium]
MIVAEVQAKCKHFFDRIPRDALIVGILIAASSLSFLLGYLSGRDGRQASVITIDIPTAPNSENNGVGETQGLRRDSGKVVASKNGSKYYLPSCAGAERISEANKVWFASAAAAARAGYAPATNCEF